jgi:fucose 4-O-acetylase-like acetyltransferase
MIENSKISSGQNRSQFIDIIKGAAIFLMLWGHCIQCCYPENKDFFLDGMFKMIYSFHMPLLMLVSGYLFCKSAQRYDKKTLLPHKVINLVRPILWGGVFVYIFTTVLFEVLNEKNLHIFLDVLLDGSWLSSLSRLWFLWSVLVATIVMCLVVMVERNSDRKFFAIVQFFIIVLGFFLAAFFPSRQNNVFMYPYFVLGYYYAKYEYNIKKFQIIKYTTFVIYPIMLLFFEKKHYIYTSGIFGGEYSIAEYIAIDAYRWIIGLVGSIFVITIVQLLLKIPVSKQFGKAVARIGQNTLQIYVLSTVFLSSYLPIGLRIIRRIQMIDTVYLWCSENMIVFYLITFIIAMIYTIVLSLIINKTRNSKISKLIFGR